MTFVEKRSYSLISVAQNIPFVKVSISEQQQPRLIASDDSVSTNRTLVHELKLVDVTTSSPRALLQDVEVVAERTWSIIFGSTNTSFSRLPNAALTSDLTTFRVSLVICIWIISLT